MQEILDETPFTIRLIGFRGDVTDGKYAEVGIKLMDALWATVKERTIANAGVNHWVYLPKNQMFTGVESSDPSQDIGSLERLDISIPRCLKAVYMGPYSGLPKAWADLKTRIAERGEKMGPVGLEIYGHCGPDAARAETTIVIGLLPKSDK